MSSPLIGPREPSTLTVHLHKGAGAPPMIDQLVTRTRHLIETDRLAAGARLPSSRALARELGVSRTVITETYGILLAEGYLEARRGSGTFVVERPSADRPAKEGPGEGERPRASRVFRAVDPPAVDPEPKPGHASFRVCEPDPASFPDRAWKTCARAAIDEALPEGYGDPAGDEDLRRAVATFVSRERGLACTPDEVVITTGTTQSLDLVSRAVLRPGDAVAVENPGYRLARQIFAERGADLRPVGVDAGGLRPEELRKGEPATLVYTTPSHQFPLGGVLSYARRAELLDWAIDAGALVIEDDYDSELRFDGPPLPPLAAGDRGGSVVYLGTFSKALAPVLRIGYLVAPKPLREAVCRLKTRTDNGTNWIVQRALARYLARGEFDRRLRRMRRLYRERRDRLVASLEPLPAGAEWIGLAAGLHAALLLPETLPADKVAEACDRRGLFVRTLADYSFGGEPPWNGLVLGYGAHPAEVLEEMGAVVRRGLREV